MECEPVTSILAGECISHSATVNRHHDNVIYCGREVQIHPVSTGNSQLLIGWHVNGISSAVVGLERSRWRDSTSATRRRSAAGQPNTTDLCRADADRLINTLPSAAWFDYQQSGLYCSGWSIWNSKQSAAIRHQCHPIYQLVLAVQRCTSFHASMIDLLFSCAFSKPSHVFSQLVLRTSIMERDISMRRPASWNVQWTELSRDAIKKSVFMYFVWTGLIRAGAQPRFESWGTSRWWARSAGL